MRQVVGRQVTDLDAAGFARLREQYRAVLLDVGTGDGKHVLHEARQRPDWLVVGLDAVADRMRDASRRAAASPARGGAPNAVFVWASVERLPESLTGVTEVHVLMPWGSLLRAMAGGDPGILAALAGACLPGATFLVTLNLHAWRPPVPEVGDIREPDPYRAVTELGPRYARAGWRIERAEYLDAAQVARLATSWTRRLGASRDRFEVLALSGTVRRPGAGEPLR